VPQQQQPLPVQQRMTQPKTISGKPSTPQLHVVEPQHPPNIAALSKYAPPTKQTKSNSPYK